MDYPSMFSRGDKVEVSTNREFTDSMFGEIIRVAGNAVNIRYTVEQEWGILKFCWHEDDPRMQELGKFEAAQGRNTDDLSGEIHMGIFRLARSQKIINETPAKFLAINEKMNAIDAMIERLVLRVAAMETKAAYPAEGGKLAAVTGKRRGRPPKQFRSTAEAELASTGAPE